MTTRLLLVRHGATVLTAEDRFAGSVDVPLGPEGRVQAELLRRRLQAEPITAVYASPMQRTCETAAIVARPHGLSVAIRDGLREVDHGRWESLRRSEVERLYTDEYLAWQRDPLTCAPSGGEAGRAVLERALRTLQDIVVRHAGQRVLVVSHKATIRLVIAHLLGFDPREYRDRLELLPAGLSILDFNGRDSARLVLFNDVSHYANEPCGMCAWA